MDQDFMPAFFKAAIVESQITAADVGTILQNKMANAMKDDFVKTMTAKFGAGLGGLGALFGQQKTANSQVSLPNVTASQMDQSISINNTFSRDESFFASAAFKPQAKVPASLAKILP